MMPEEFHKCDREKGYCRSMMDRSDSVGNARRGLIRMSAMDFSVKDKPRIVPIGIMYKVDAKDRGLMLNVCPFCREDIDYFRQDRMPSESKEATDARQR